MASILIDTNILIYTKTPASPDHKRAKGDIERLVFEGHELFVCPQVLRECYKVMMTPSTSNGLSMSPADAQLEIQSIIDTYSLTQDSNQVFEKWRMLVDDFKVIGKNAHDTHIVACMLINLVSGILTYNTKYFKHFDKMISLHP